MDRIFGIGAPELILILLLAGIVMGPQRIHQVARRLGRITTQLQAIAREFARQLSAELDAVDSSGDIKRAAQDVQELQRQITDLRRELTSVAMRPIHEGREAARESQKLLKQAVELPAIHAPDARMPESANGESPQLPKLLEVPDDPE